MVENEARDTLLDRAGGSHEAPSSQILRYLGRAEAQSGGTLRWGLLTNGRFWRLYWAQARVRAEGFVEIELPALIGDLPPPVPSGADPEHWLRVFMLLFGRNALIREGVRGETFLDVALAEGRRFEQQVTEALSRIVFDRVYPELVSAIGYAAPDPRPNEQSWRTEVRDTSLRLLFRFLFLLYAEDRDLLPVRHDVYRQYGLRPMREEAAEIVDGKRTVSDRRTTWWPRLTELFGAIANGDTDMALPPYNGGLFDDSEAPLLSRISLPDRTLAGLIDALSRESESRRWINYRDLSVQQLGSIYERLLEREVAPDENDNLILRPSIFARRTTGSYYTPEELVRLILRRAIGPLLAERRQAFANRVNTLASDRRPKAERLRSLSAHDPAESFVKLRVCDPAMGSGHFLVSLVDYLADEVLTAMSEAPALVAWANAEQPYRSPLAARIERLRREIRRSADENRWPVSDEQLNDRHLVRRIILKRVIYGVDLNPMAVELAKLSLWLHSFTVGAPLSFLDHHLRCGDSLFGEFVGPIERQLHEQYGLVFTPEVAQARQAAAGMARVEELADADIGEVRSSREAFAGVEDATAALRAFLDLTHAARWRIPADDADELARALLFGGNYGNPVAIAAGEPLRPPREEGAAVRQRRRGAREVQPAEVQSAAAAFIMDARAFAAERRFFHWEPAFPGVWTEWDSVTPSGGFDAVIGNPPWDRMKLQEVEWFAPRVEMIAHAQRASDRKRMIKELQRRRDPIAADYDRAAGIAESAVRVARSCGAYPLLSSGDINIYSLFVERALRLVRREGIVGLVTPIGIGTDKTAARFFSNITETERLGAFISFENRRGWLFRDVHHEDQPTVIIIGGCDRRFPIFPYAVKLRAMPNDEVLEAQTLSADECLNINPNTGTAPIFRSPRDAVITSGIYRRVPVFVDRRGEEPVSVWPVRYLRMFDMTNDSDKFRTAVELESLGAYRVARQCWERGNQRWLPLYEGKMVSTYNHRYAGVLTNPNNISGQGVAAHSTLEQLSDPSFFPTPRYWVEEKEIEYNHQYGLGFNDICNTNNQRSLISAMVPRSAFGNKLPVLHPEHFDTLDCLPLLLANLNSIICDYVARQKIQSRNLNKYILEQLPLVPSEAFERRLGAKTAAQLIQEDVLHLTYTAYDMAAFARDQGYDGPPFRWDEEDRLRRRARLDALFFHLYGLDRDAAEYVLGTFPIVRREEEERWGRFRSRDLILGYMAALAAGAPDAEVAG